MLLVSVTGVLYGVMRYLLDPVDPFSVVNHPWQGDVQHLHILVAPLLVFAVGLIWRRHILLHWQDGVKTGRRSGVEVILTTTPMVASGYLIQTTVTDSGRLAWIIIHCTTSGLWVAGYLIHQIASRRGKRQARDHVREQAIERQPPVSVA